ncbi:MAG: flagellar hook-length control protein FliK [Pseudomonadota bacterium]|uniref:flagellar hook-length control protein FliK n=1 Tax=Gallaecimonas pentaromativorans TaxID=584787 RepID=UPI00067EAAF4|nr:flagellar hook-length control protein FliK [Gallaecimonas pentaromativorans]MED5526550.1 flagellar hook-length control protein FliK [Pseudomonadota bacterium]
MKTHNFAAPVSQFAKASDIKASGDSAPKGFFGRQMAAVKAGAEAKPQTFAQPQVKTTDLQRAGEDALTPKEIAAEDASKATAKGKDTSEHADSSQDTPTALALRGFRDIKVPAKEQSTAEPEAKAPLALEPAQAALTEATAKPKADDKDPHKKTEAPDKGDSAADAKVLTLNLPFSQITLKVPAHPSKDATTASATGAVDGIGGAGAKEPKLAQAGGDALKLDKLELMSSTDKNLHLGAPSQDSLLASQQGGTGKLTALPEWAPIKMAAGNPAQSQPGQLQNGQELAAALGDRLQLQVSQQIKEARVRLDPPDMGRVDLTVRMEGDRLSVHLQASQPMVRDMLHQQLDRLRLDLVQQHGTQVEVSVGQDRGQSGRQGGGDPRSQEPQIMAAQVTASGDEEQRAQPDLPQGWVSTTA